MTKRHNFNYQIRNIIFVFTETACQALDNPQNGQWNCNRHDLELGTICSVVCNNGYRLIGNGDRECIMGTNLHGDWTGVTGTCAREYSGCFRRDC